MRRITLKAARTRAGLTQDELAAKTGLDQTTISSLETGRKSRPTFDTVLRLAKALGVPAEALKFEPHSNEAMAS